jgi:hypothetical protein
MKFGETLKSRDRVAQTNELLAKLTAYNITVLIHEMFEHGVIPDFLTPRRSHRADLGTMLSPNSFDLSHYSRSPTN